MKDKRQILRSLLQKLRNEYQVSAAEVDDYDLWGNACVGIALATNDAGHAESVLQKVVDFIDENPAVEIEGFDRRIERV